MKRWTNGLPGAAKRLGAMMALRGLSGSQPGCARIPMMARSNIAPLKRPDTLMQLSRSPARHSTLHRAAGPYIMARSGGLMPRTNWVTIGEKRTCGAAPCRLARALLTHLRHRRLIFVVMHNSALADDMVGCGLRPEG